MCDVLNSFLVLFIALLLLHHFITPSFDILLLLLLFDVKRCIQIIIWQHSQSFLIISDHFYNHFWSFVTFKVCPMMMRMTIYFSHQTLSIVCYTTPYLPACIWCMLLWPKCYYSCYNYLLTTITTYLLLCCVIDWRVLFQV